MAKWILWLAVVIAAVVFGPRLYTKIQSYQGAECKTSDEHNVASPDGRFVAHAERNDCRGRDPELRVTVALREHPESPETAFVAKARQYLPDFEGPQEIKASPSWSGASELTIYYPEGAAVQTAAGPKGIGVEVKYTEEVRRR